MVRIPPSTNSSGKKTRHGGWWIQWWPGLGLRLHLRCGYPSVDGNYRGQVMVAGGTSGGVIFDSVYIYDVDADK